MGSIRKSNTTNTLVIVSDHTKGLYEDRWEGDVLHYTGMGKNNYQDINFSQNRTLNESNTNGIDVFLFKVVKEREYIYLGQVILCGDPYQEQQPGEDGQMRKVWIFPVKLINNEGVFLLTKNLIKQNYIEKQKKAKRMSTTDIKNKAILKGKKNMSKRNSVVKTYERNPSVIEFAKRRANGEEDTIENTVALCPNCISC